MWMAWGALQETKEKQGIYLWDFDLYSGGCFMWTDDALRVVQVGCTLAQNCQIIA